MRANEIDFRKIKLDSLFLAGGLESLRERVEGLRYNSVEYYEWHWTSTSISVALRGYLSTK